MNATSIFFALEFLILTGCSKSPAPDNREADARALREGEVAAFVKDWGGKDAIGKAMKEALVGPNWSLALQPVHLSRWRSPRAAISAILVEPMC